MPLYKPTDQVGQPLNVIYAEDVWQLADLMSGNRDGGAMSLLAPLATPPAPTSVTLQSGGITGTGYQWGIYWITGFMDGTGTAHITGRTPYGTLTTAQALTAQKATVSISAVTVPTGAIGWGVARNKSPGGTASAFYTVPLSEQFLSVAGTMPNSFIDNVADASLVTLAPTVNTTGTTLAGVPGFKLDFAQITATVTAAGTTEGAATAVVTGNSVTYDGTMNRIEFWSPSAGNVQTVLTLVLLRDSTVIGHSVVTVSAAAPIGIPCGLIAYDTPTAGAHTYKIQAYSASGSATIIAGLGGPGNNVPAWLRVTKA